MFCRDPKDLRLHWVTTHPLSPGLVSGNGFQSSSYDPGPQSVQRRFEPETHHLARVGPVPILRVSPLPPSPWVERDGKTVGVGSDDRSRTRYGTDRGHLGLRDPNDSGRTGEKGVDIGRQERAPVGWSSPDTGWAGDGTWSVNVRSQVHVLSARGTETYSGSPD